MGSKKLKVPAGAQPGNVFRIRGEGLPDIRTGRRGDVLVRIMIEIPRKLTTEQERLLRAFAELEDKQVMPESKGFFEKLKNHFGNG